MIILVKKHKMEEEIIEETNSSKTDVVNIPTFFKNRYLEQVDDFVVKQNNMKALRINTLKISEEKLVKILKKKGVKLKKIDFLDYGYTFESEFSMSSTPEYLKGYFYLQEAASQIPVQVLDCKLGDNILDMNAAPGSKTTQIAQYIKDKGSIVALDIVNKRISALNNNLERMGVETSVVYLKDSRYAEDFNIIFDKILIDAPCSGNYCVEKDWFTKRSKQDFLTKSEIQKQLLAEGFKILKKGGILVYSTCSLEKEEDEDVVEWALENFDLEIVDTGLKIGNPGCTDKTKLTKKFWPYKTGTQGFFVAKFKKF